MARVQSVASGYQTGSGTSRAVTINGVTAGNLLCGFITFGGTTNTALLSSITDDNGNTYTIVDRVADTADSQCAASFYALNVNSGNTVVTANFSSGVEYRDIRVMELSGRHTSNAQNANAANYQGPLSAGTDAVTSGNDTTTVNGCDIVGYEIASSGITSDCTAGTSFTQYDLDSTIADTSVEFRNQASSGSVAATFTTGTSFGHWLCLMLAFEPAGGGGGGATLRKNSLMRLGVGR